MAEQSLSQLTSPVKSGNLIHIDFLNDETPVVLSTDVARHFQKKHKHVLDDIRRIQSICPKSFFGPNFRPIETEVTVGFGIRKNPAYLLTRDAFSLLVMGFTGSAAIRWKLRYIEAFNALEAAVRENVRTDALTKSALAVESAFRQGYDAGRASALPDVLGAEQKARLDTARLLWRFGPERKRRLRAAVRYRKMGLGIHDIAKLLDVSNREISSLLDAAEALGELPPRRERPALRQGNLLTDGVASGSELIAKAARSSRVARVNMDATPERGKEVGA